MNDNKTEDKLTDLYRNIKDYIREDLWLSMWRIWLGIENMKIENKLWELRVCDYNHMLAEIIVNWKYFLIETEISFEEIFQTILHEILHIFCWAWTWYMKECKNTLDWHLPWPSYNAMWDHIMVYEEMMVTTLTLKLIWKYKETKEYEYFEKVYNQIIEWETK